MKICIIGGTGFIGRHLCEMTQSLGLAVVVIYRNSALKPISRKFENVLFLKNDSLEARENIEDSDVLVYLASQSLPGSNWNNPSSELSRCSISDIEFLEKIASINPKCHIIYASSGGQIYGAGHNSPICETTITSPVTAYALGKQTIESALNIISFSKGNPVTILRIANPVGRWQINRRHGLVNAAITAGLKNEVLNLYGDGGNLRDYFDADDLARLFIKVAFGSSRILGTYNVGSNRGLTEIDIIGMVSKVMNIKIKINNSQPRPFDLRYSVLDSTKIEKISGWSAKTPLEETIKDMLSHREKYILENF